MERNMLTDIDVIEIDTTDKETILKFSNAKRKFNETFLADEFEKSEELMKHIEIMLENGKLVGESDDQILTKEDEIV